MNQIDSRSIDLLITDPPYGIDFISGQRRVKKYGKIKNDDNLNWLNRFLDQCKRVLKDDAHAYIFCSHHNIDVFMALAKEHLPYKSMLVWEKDHFGMGDLKGDYAPQYELIIYCSNGRKKLNGRRDSNILKFKKTGNKLHPTEKPVDLFKFMIEKSSVEGDIILDPFAGSGTTGVAASEINRNYILMEKDPIHFTVMENRLNLN